MVFIREDQMKICPCTSEAFTGQRLKCAGMRKGNPTLNSPPLVTNMKCGHPRPTRGRCGNISSSAFSAVLPLICLKASTARHSPKKTCQGQNGDAHWFSAQNFNLYSPKTFCSRPSDCQVFCYICSFLAWGKF